MKTIETKLISVLQEYFGYSEFRDTQKDIMLSVLSGRDTLAVMPTGGGKSLCYQVPALILDGLTLVISPLIALMQDQVSQLEKTGIPSLFLNSSLDW
jgi:ATP-dependent DNA helicase RecQ